MNDMSETFLTILPNFPSYLWLGMFFPFEVIKQLL